MSARAAAALLIVLALPACLERADEEPGYSVHVLHEGVASNAGASGPLVPLHTGFSAGAPVQYWDFGTATSSVKPVWILQRDGEPIDHPPLVDSLPGDDAYTPFRAVFTVEVGASYGGERITTLAALEDAIELGLLHDPEPTGDYVSWPITPAGFALERAGQEPVETRELYGKGFVAHYLPLLSLDEAQPFERSVSARAAYMLRLQHEDAPLEEPVLGADLNEDGDELDSNVIFAAGSAPSGLWAPTEIIVASDYAFGAYRASTDLFGETEQGDPVAVPEAFIAQSAGRELLYRPLYMTEAP